MEDFSKIIKITDKDGHKHSYLAKFVDGEITPEGKADIERLKNGESLDTPKDEEPKYEVVNDESIDAIKDNFTPPCAKDEEPEVEVDELDAYTKDLEDYLDKNPDAKKKNYY